jgi:MFS family permease
MVGIYYLFPVLGPSVGTLLGGALSLTEPEWRTTFWFMFAYASLVFVWSIFFQDTFRKERSLAWRAAYKRAVIAAKLKDESRKEAAFQAARDGTALPNQSGRKLPWNRTNTKSSAELKNGKVAEKEDLERATNKKIIMDAKKKLGMGAGLTKVTTETGEEIPVKVSFRDVK